MVQNAPCINLPQEFQKKPGFSYNLENAENLLYLFKQMFFCLFDALQWETVGIEWDFLIYMFYVYIHIHIHIYMQWI